MTRKLRCCIIDDMPQVADVLVHYLKSCPELELVSVETDAVAALQKLQQGQLQVDIIFLDIDMPGLSGIDLARELRGKVRIIFTTGHREFGPEAFELRAIDYLIKPIRPERFKEAVEKLKAAMSLHPVSGNIGIKLYFHIRGDGKNDWIRIPKDDLIYIEGASNYIHVFTEKTKYVSYGQIKEMEGQLTLPQFMRIHKSYLVNLYKIVRIKTDCVILSSQDKKVEIPIGITYREVFFAVTKNQRNSA